MQAKLGKRARLNRQSKNIFPSGSAERWKAVSGHEFPTFLEEVGLTLHLSSSEQQFKEGSSREHKNLTFLSKVH